MTKTIHVERTFDWELVRRIFASPEIYKHLGDDFSPSQEAYEPVTNPSLIYLLASNGHPCGIFLFAPENGICFNTHIAFLPSGWGAAREAAKQAAVWMFSNTRCQRIVASVPAYNRLALKTAKATGVTQFGVNEASFLKNGKLHDQILLGLSKEK